MMFVNWVNNPISLNIKTHPVYDARRGQAEFLKKNYELYLINIMLPQKDGFTLAKDIRTVDDSVPILFLTAKSMKEDRIKGFKIGGDDYITKPFSMEELLLRIEAVLKRSGQGPSREKKDRFFLGNFTLNYEKRELIRKKRSVNSYIRRPNCSGCSAFITIAFWSKSWL